MLSKLSVRKPYTVFVCIVLVLLLGYVSYLNMKVDLIPSVNLPYVVVTTAYVGASPEKVEKKVSEPLEGSLSSINNIKSVKSVSSENGSMIIMEFNDNANMESVMLEINENIDAIKNSFSDEISNPEVMKINPNSLPIMMISVSDETMTKNELQDYINDEVIPKFKSVEGVATVTVSGEVDNMVNVVISDEKIEKLNENIKEKFLSMYSPEMLANISEEDLKSMKFNIDKKTLGKILLGQNFDMPSYSIAQGVTDGYVKVSVGDEFNDIADIENLLVADIPGYGEIRIEDICDVKKSDNSAEKYTVVNGKNALVLSLQKESNYSTAEISTKIWEQTDILQNSMETLEISTLMDQGRYVGIMLGRILMNLLIGAAFAIVVLLIFLKNIKATALVSTSIFISIIFAITLMYMSDISLNMISMGGLALGVGMLVDNSIVVLENIFRIRNQDHSISRKDASIKGAREVAGAITASTLTTIVVFVPIVFTHGLTRELFTDMALTIGFALISSLFVALTLIPAVTSVMKSAKKVERKTILQKITDRYVKFLEVCLGYKWVTFTVVIMLFVTSIITALNLDVSLFPVLDSGNIWIKSEIPDSYNSEERKLELDKLYSVISDIDDVKTIGIIDDTAMVDSNNIMMNLAGEGVSTYVLLNDERGSTTEEISRKITKEVENFGYPISVNSDGLDLSNLFSQDLVIEISGTNIDDIENSAKKVYDNVKDIQGVENVTIGNFDDSKKLEITVNKDEAIKHGLSVAQVYMLISDITKPDDEITNFTDEDGIEYSVHVKDSEDQKISSDNISNIKIKDAKGEMVELSELITMDEVNSANTIYRTSGKRYIDVQIEIKDGYNLKDVTNEVEDSLDLDKSEYKIAGQIFEINSSFGDLYLMMILAAIFIYLIMVAQFQSLISPFIIMFTLLLALTGGFLALHFTGYPLSIIAIIGFIMLIGIVVNNGIVLVDYANQQMAKNISKREAILISARYRFRPILMTAITTIAALLVSALDTSMGSEMLRPMAIVTIGGMIYSTTLTLVVIPSLYELLIRKKSDKNML